MTIRVHLKYLQMTEEQFAALATEFYGRAEFPAGNHMEAEVLFEDAEGHAADNLARMFLTALKAFNRPAP